MQFKNCKEKTGQGRLTWASGKEEAIADSASQMGSSKVGHGKKSLDFKSMAPNNLV